VDPSAPSPRILLGEDDPDTRQLLAFVLGEQGYAVAEVADGEAALRSLGSGRFDLVITDYDMPGMSGAEMLKRAGAHGTLGGASALVITAHPDPRGVPDEATVLHKPVDLERLLVQVRMILPGGEGEARSPAPGAGEPALDLALYVSPRSPASIKARHRMSEVLAEYDAGRVRFEVCDLFEHAAAAERDRVVFTPTLVKRRPAPRAWILGDLTDADVVRDLISMCGVARRDGAEG
jgi:CheY-like chemotaxis protein